MTVWEGTVGFTMNSLLHLCIAFTLCGTSLALTEKQLTRMSNKIAAVIRVNNTLPAIVRLAFHDCVGGCDGCLNINNADNAGLEDVVASLDTVYTDNSYADWGVSRADFWAYAGYCALETAVEKANEDCVDDCVPDLGLVFKYGRVDCDTAPYTTVDVGLPSPHLNYDELMEFFAIEFGFSADEVVALMGVHNLGGAESYNSGFKGSWVQGETSLFNNNYYSIMVDSANTWRQRDVSEDGTPAYEWIARDVGFMLNADMAIYKEFTLDDDGISSCTYDNCPATASAATVEKYAASNDVWFPDFAAVFTKMVEHVDSSVTLIEVDA